MGGDLPSGTVTFLFTDIEGSTRLWEQHPEDMGLALERHDEILRESVASFGGVVFATGGDGFAAAFSDATDAGGAAKESQALLDAEEWPGSLAVRVRMGLHTGQAVERGGDYFGPVVNRAARVMSCGHGGQVLLTATTMQLLGEVEAVDLGEHRLKDLMEAERLFQLGVGEFPELRSLRAARNNLPVQRTELLGRDEDVESIAEMLDARRLVTLTGFGGTGKTRLALAAAADRAHRFPQGVFFVDLAPLSDGSLVGLAAAEAVGLATGQVTDTGSALDQAAAGLSGKDLLLILDNCEHVIDEVVEFVDRLLGLDTVPTVLATSREALEIDGEHQYRVSPLDVADLDERSPAVELFVQRASAVGSFVDPSDPAVGAVCRQLDGLPLAIELAAARTATMRPSELATRLGEKFDLLATRRRRGRHRSLEAVLEWSWELLHDDAQSLLVQLGTFTGGWTLEAAEAVCDDPATVAARMQTLVATSLVETLNDGSGTRFRMLEPVRQFAAARLGQGPRHLELRGRHLAYWLDNARAKTTNDHWCSTEWAAQIRADFDNYRAVVEGAFDDEPDAAVELLCAGSVAWFDGARNFEVDLLFDRAFETVTEPSPLLLLAAAFNDITVGDHVRLAARTQAAAAHPEADQDLACAALVASYQGFSRATIDPTSAVPLVKVGIEKAADAGATDLLCLTLAWGASTLHIADRSDEALELTRQARDLDVQAASLGRFHALYAEYFIHLGLDDLEQARATYDELDRFGRSLPPTSGHADTVERTGSFLQAHDGNLQGLNQALEANYREARTTGIQIGLNDVVLAIAELIEHRGHSDAAGELIAALHRQPLTHPLVYHRYRNARARLPRGQPPDHQLETTDLYDMTTNILLDLAP